MSENVKKKPLIALSLGGGGAKTFAHLGAIDALKKHNIPIDFLVTCSAASIIGVLYGLGVSSEEIKKEFKRKRKWIRLIRSSVFKQILKKFIAQSNIKDLKELNTPISIVTVDLKAGEEVVFEEGDPFILPLASSAFPGISKPFKYLDYGLIDGAILKPDPADIARQKVGSGGVVISVTLGLEFQAEESISRVNTIIKSMLLLSCQNRDKILYDNSDIVINPTNGLGVSFKDWKETFLGYYNNKKIERYYKKGFDSIEEKIEEIRQVIADKTNS